MNKKLIINNTILTTLIILFITIFKKMFGESNSLVGVAIITAALALLQRNLSYSFKEYLIKVTILNIFLGVMSYLGNINFWIGIPINFIALFIIGYFCISNFKISIAIPFGLEYMFMVFAPVYKTDFALRISGLLFGSLFIMLLQLLFNKNKIEKVYKTSLVNSLSQLTLAVRNDDKAYQNITNEINNLKKIIYESRKKNFFLSEIGKNLTDIIYLLESINIRLNKNKINDDDLSKYLIDIFESLKYKIQNEDEKNIKIGSYDEQIDCNTRYLLIEVMNLVDEINKFEILGKSKEVFYKASNKFSSHKILKDNFTMSSLKVSYSVKLAFIGTLSIFFAKYFNILQGRWIAYTIFSLIQPYSEMMKIRAKERIKGTIIGVLIIVVLFTFVESSAVRGMIILLAGYLNSYAKDYKNAMIIVTISAVASVSVVGGVISFGLQRVVFVALGAIFSIIGNKYIMPYKIQDGNKEIEENYKKLIKNIDVDVNNNEDEHLIKSLYLIPSFFETKLKNTNTDKKELEHLMKISDENRIKINEIYRKYYIKKDNSYLVSRNKHKIAVSE